MLEENRYSKNINIKLEFEIIEKNLFKTKPDKLNCYYNCLNEKQIEEFFIKIFLILKNEDNFSIRKVLNKISDELSKNINFDFDKFNDLIIMRSYKDFMYGIFSFFIVKAFQNINTSNNDNSDNFNLCNSDQLINLSSENFINLCLYFNFNLKLKIEVDHSIIREIYIKAYFINIKHKLIFEILIKNKYSKKTYKYFYINITFNLEYLDLKVYNTPFILHQYENSCYLCNNHFSSIIEINRKNLFSNFKFQQNVFFSISLTRNYFYIDKTRLLVIIDTLLSFYKIDKNTIITDYTNLQELLKKSIFENNSYSIKKISQSLSIYLNLIKLIKISLLDLDNTKIYTPHIICFRGRFSALSDVSYTFNKEFRYCIYLGFYENLKDREKLDVFTKKINKIMMQYKYILNDCKLINSLDKYDETEIRTLLFLLINIAEINKVKLGKSVNIEQFFKEGINILNNYNTDMFNDVYDKIRIEYYIFIFNEVLNKTNKKWLVSKDATASCFQHLIKILGYKDINSIVICNLFSEDTWYDTYQHNIDHFLKNKILLYLTEDDLKNYFNRKVLKPTQMKESYGIGLVNAKNEFIENIKINELNSDKRKELLKLFFQFYWFLKKNPLLFKNQPIEIIHKICVELKGEINFENNEKADLKYFKIANYQKSYYIGKVRYTKNTQVLLDDLDIRKMKIAARANYVQSIESAVARKTLFETSCPIIHDCFMIDVYNQSYLLSVINKNMNINYHDLKITNWDFKIFSIFIIL